MHGEYIACDALTFYTLLANKKICPSCRCALMKYILYMEKTWNAGSLRASILSRFGINVQVGTNENGSACGRWLSIGI